MYYNSPTFDIGENDDDMPVVDCKYYEPSKMKDILHGGGESVFSVLCLNVRSCRRNFGLLMTFLNAYLMQFTLIVLLETWLTKDIDHALSIGG